jgi:hypothetical protein
VRARVGLAILIGAMYAGFAGFLLVVFWAAEVYGSSHESFVEDQPAPAWLWQLGVGLGLGAAVVFVLLVTLSRVRAPAPMTARPQWTSNTVLTATMLAETVACALLVSIVSTESVHRWWPLGGATLMCVVLLVVVPRWER